MKRSARAVSLMTGAALAAGCAEGPSSRMAPAVPEWRLEETLRIGSVADPRQSLTRVVGPVIGPEDRVYVGQPMQAEVRMFDRAGRLLGVAGREGSGPGEFDSPIMVVRIRGDSLVVVEWSGEIEFFTFDGAPLATEGFRVSPDDGRPLPTVVTDFLADGSVLANRAMSPGDPLVTLHAERSGKLIDTVFVGASPNIALTVGRAVVRIQNPFPSQPFIVTDAKRGHVVAVERSPAEGPGAAAFSVTKLTVGADTIYARAYANEPVPIPAEAVDSAVARAALRLRRIEPNPARAEALVRQAIEIPRYYIAVTGALVAEDGRLWLETGGPVASERTWRVHDGSGELLAEVSVPAAAELRFVRGDEAWAVVTDELDVPYVVRYRVVRPEGA